MRKKKHSYPPGVHLPEWFVRELARLDRNLYLSWNIDSQCWEIWKDLEVYTFDEKGKKRHQVIPFCRAVFERLDQSALDNLNMRRKLGERLMDRPGAYLRYLKEDERRAKAKEKELALDMQVEGFMKMHRLNTSKTFS
jgi:hypothetical protein